jgi:hypothetical protein
MAKAATKEKKVKPEAPRPRSDAYVMMLFITFLAITTGAALMYFDFAGTKEAGIGEDEGYGNRVPPKEPVPTLPKLGESIKMAEPPPEPKPMDPAPEPKKDPEPDPKKDPEPKKDGM